VKLDQKEWWDLCGRVSRYLEDDVEWFGKIVQHYDEPQRRYHNQEHIAHCLGEFRVAPRLTENPAEVETALWLHDVIYDPKRSDNEEKSAEFAREFSREARAGDLFERRVVELILATKHNAAPVSEDARVVVDIDLAILGQPEDRFWRYEREIREEYAFVPENIFRTKRAEILEMFLKRERIYSTDFFFAKYEGRARENLKKSIEALRVGL
jgi:predicted metal-dependent HD superfamily phosphohydrolase